MQNQRSCQQGFIPVEGNWDFNHREPCRKNDGRARNHEGCQCERSDRNTSACGLEENCGRKGNDRGCRGGNVQPCGGYETGHNRPRCTGCDDCPCDACTRRREGAACKDNASACDRSGKNRHVGMIRMERQEIGELFGAESGLRAGTIFPELHKPMNGYYPCDGNCGTCKQAAAFAAWELRLYLNTHPYDKEALALFCKLCREADGENYASAFLTDDGAGGWNWVRNPWPWEYSANCCD